MNPSTCDVELCNWELFLTVFMLNFPSKFHCSLFIYFVLFIYVYPRICIGYFDRNTMKFIAQLAFYLPLNNPISEGSENVVEARFTDGPALVLVTRSAAYVTSCSPVRSVLITLIIQITVMTTL